MEAYLEDSRPTLDDICESYKECCKECPAYEVCKAESEDREIKSKSFNDYQEAFIFNDKVNGQIQWC